MSQGTFTQPPPRQFRPNVPPGPGPAPQPSPTPTPIPGTLLYDSFTHSKLHNKIARRFVSEGSLAPNGKGIECRASGSPVIQVNPDGTFSLICQPGHGRFYLYVNNFNAAFIIWCAFWNQNCRDISLKARSRHNLADPCSNRFGGYGMDINRGNQWDAKREPCHNNHDQSQGGSLRVPPVGQFFKLGFIVKGTGPVIQQGFLNDKQFMQKVDNSPQGYMIDPRLYNQNSYLWFRQNNTNGTAEIRIQRMQVYSV